MEEKYKKLKSWHIIFLMILVIAFIVVKIWQLQWPEAVVNLKGVELNVLIAQTPHHMYKGLSGREFFGEHDAMLFVFGYKDKHGIVMRDMKFPIDIVWFNDGLVVDIASFIKPEFDVSEENLMVYRPRVDANVVLELPAGWTVRNDLKIGDKITLVEE